MRGLCIWRSAASACRPSPSHSNCWRPRWAAFSTSHAVRDAHEPLRILFCGSDDFSCASLEALHAEMQKQHQPGRPCGAAPGRIASLDVVVRPAKRTGRGLKTLHESPVKALATKLGLCVHERDTFTGWQPPPSNMIIAVSFGLFVPPRLLRAARFGGLNVHPSLLPDLPGATPIEHAILAGYARTGVSVQTLDERAFDGGRVLLQDSETGLAIPPRCTAAALRRLLAPRGAGLLVDVLRRGLYCSGDGQRVSQSSASASASAGETPRQSPGPLLLAPRLTKADRQVPWRAEAGTEAEAESTQASQRTRHQGRQRLHTPKTTAETVDRRARALGPLWTHVTAAAPGATASGQPPPRVKRAILEDIGVAAWPAALLPALQRVTADADGAGLCPLPTVTFVQTRGGSNHTAVTLPFLVDAAGGQESILLPVGAGADGPSSSPVCLRIDTIKLEGDRAKAAGQAIAAFAQKGTAWRDISWDVAM